MIMEIKKVKIEIHNILMDSENISLEASDTT